VQFLQLGRGIGAQLLGEPPADPRVAVQRLGTVAGGGKGAHEHRGEGLDQGKLAGQLAKRADDRLGIAQPQFDPSPGHRRDHPLPLAPLALALEPRPRQAGERYAPPQARRLAKQRRPLRRRPVPGPFDEPAEPVQVDPVRVHVQQVGPAPVFEPGCRPTVPDGAEQRTPDPGDAGPLPAQTPQ
jgi:hypothetical protein